MDAWEIILAGACLGTFILEVWGFWKIITLIQEIKTSLGMKDGYAFQPGDLLADGFISLIERMAEDSERGERARQASAAFIAWGTDIAKQKLFENTPLDGKNPMEIKGMPKQAKGLMGILQFANDIGLLEGAKKGLKKGTQKAVEAKLDAYGLPIK